VSQLLDRTDYMAMLSHLRRVIHRFLERSLTLRPVIYTQLNGAAFVRVRHLKPNCGLVKNFAQQVELSTALEDETTVLSTLEELGYTPIGRIGREVVSEVEADDRS